MSSSLRKAILIFFTLSFIGCAGSKPSRWGHFHGDASNLGFQSIRSGFALSSSWRSNSYKITSSSPVIGIDFQNREVIYIGTIDAKLIAIRSEDGTEKWRRLLGAEGSNARIVSSASVSDRGDIYVVTNRDTKDGRILSTLHKVDQYSNPKWSYSFSDNGYTTGSPKVFKTPNGTLIFIYVTIGMAENMQGELFVLRDDGAQVQLLDHKGLGACRFDFSGGNSNFDKIISAIRDTSDLIGNFPVASDESGPLLSGRFLDPTVAVCTIEEKLLIAVADSLCSIGVFEWNGADLAVLWRQEHGFDNHSSAVVLPNGLMVFGRQDGKVSAYDVLTGLKIWEYNAGQAVWATPAGSPEMYVFIVSQDHIQVISAADGALIRDNNFSAKIRLAGVTHSSPAVTADRVYVSALEMLTATYDLKTTGHDTNFSGNGLSSVAVGRDGAVYGVAADGTIRKYSGTE